MKWEQRSGGGGTEGRCRPPAEPRAKGTKYTALASALGMSWDSGGFDTALIPGITHVDNRFEQKFFGEVETWNAVLRQRVETAVMRAWTAVGC